jgi:hypothetical protein
MNIFYTDSDPKIAAQNMVDRHVVKMILESAQLLSTAHRLLDAKEYVGKSESGKNIKRWKLSNEIDEILYSATHNNHPSSIWTRKNSANYDWLYVHFISMGEEYTHRYGRNHLTIEKLGVILKAKPKNINKSETITKMFPCMDEKYVVSEDPITNYRNYYNNGKADLFRWTNRKPPSWIIGDITVTEDKKHNKIYLVKNNA